MMPRPQKWSTGHWGTTTTSRSSASAPEIRRHRFLHYALQAAEDSGMIDNLEGLGGEGGAAVGCAWACVGGAVDGLFFNGL